METDKQIAGSSNWILTSCHPHCMRCLRRERERGEREREERERERGERERERERERRERERERLQNKSCLISRKLASDLRHQDVISVLSARAGNKTDCQTRRREHTSTRPFDDVTDR